MIWPRASSKLKIRPWVALKETPVYYFAREFPVVFFSGIVAAAVTVPFLGYLISQTKAEPRGSNQIKAFYTIYRPDDYPKELHKYCR